MNEIVSTFVEVLLEEEDDFLKVKETLSRIGIASRKDKKLFQSCHILHKQGRYYIVHFKELFLLDGKPSDLSENDIARRNTIINLLLEWDLVSLVNVEELEPVAPMNQVKILRYDEKDEWELVVKYNIGRT
tara:strand:+ start:230 stop:622 length:393 start_codon:yes stop_codon:yes gene_type:complete